MPDFLHTLPGIEFQRAPMTREILLASQDRLPTGFPLAQWNAQSERYVRYWRWFNGDELAVVNGKTVKGEPVLRYPLGINAVRNFARKHGTLLMGEGTDTPAPMVSTTVTPKFPLDGGEASDEDKKTAAALERIVNLVWADSFGRAAQIQAAILSQFLGGYVFQVRYVPQRADDLTFPLMVQGLPPDFCLPVWGSEDEWWLHEMFVVYRIPGAIAQAQYGYTGQNAWVIYCEHWTRTDYSIYVDGQPVTAFDEVKDQAENPFGFVPFVYIPHAREGNFYGSSLVDDIEGLVKEYNARLADQGTAIKDTVRRKRYLRNSAQPPKEKQIGNNLWVIDLGMEAPVAKHPPEVVPEDPPNLSNSLVDFARQTLWGQLLREGSLGPIAFGEDEGSQRSALTLAFRMWPSTSHAHTERTFWTDGLNVLAIQILRMMAAKNLGKTYGLSVPPDFRQRFALSQNWQSMIPRDREQLINELVILRQAGVKSRRSALIDLDVRNVEDELAEIEKDLRLDAAIAALGKPQPATSTGAKTDVVTPVASTGLSEKDGV